MRQIPLSRRRFSAPVFFALCGLGSAAAADPPELPRQVVHALPDAIRLLDVPSYENSVAVVPPSAGTRRGAVVVLTGGYARGSKFLVRPLLGSNGAYDRDSGTREVEFPHDPAIAVATDNQLVRLTDGTLLAEKDSYVSRPIRPTPAWKDEWVSGRFSRGPLQRGTPVFFASKDAGATWAVASVLDLAVLVGGRYGIPRPMTKDGRADVPVSEQGVDAEGHRFWWVGGADRTEVYACPFTGIVWCTTRIISGPYRDVAPQRNTTLLFRSVDGGATWEPVKEDLPAWSPTVMTSTADGRLFLFQTIGDSPILWWSDAPTSRVRPTTIVGGKPTFYVEGGKRVMAAGDVGVDLELKLAAPSIARAGTSAKDARVRLAYQALNAAGRQTACVVEARVRDGEAEPEVANVARLSAADPERSSAMYFTFVEPGADALASVARELCLLYWVEAPAKDAPAKTYGARYALFDRRGLVGPPAWLSVRGGAPRPWATRQDPGDYLKGAYFERNGRPSFLCVWPQPDGLFANVVEVSPTAAK
jgi:hypothetical protein